jgi:PAS domain S-box-containing protein
MSKSDRSDARASPREPGSGQGRASAPSLPATETEPPFRDVLAASPLLITIVDRDGRIGYQNHAVRGLSLSEVIGKDLSTFVEAPFHDIVRGAIAHVFEKEAPASWEMRAAGNDGVSTWYQCWAGPVRERGVIVGAVIAAADITAGKVVEDQTERLARLLMHAERMAHLGSWEWRIATNEVLWSDELYRIYALTPREFSASLEGFLERVVPDGRDDLKNTIQRAVAERGRFEVHERIMRPDGEERTLHSLGEMIESAPGDWRMVGVCMDVTEQYRLERELRESEAQLRKTNEELDARVAERTRELTALNEELEALTYSVSHDLRAPLRAIDGFSRALEQDHVEHLDDSARDYLRRVRRATHNMAQRIDDLLSLSRVASSEISFSRVDLAALAREITEELRTTAPEREVTFVIPDELAVHGDAHLLRVVLENLLGNAWKFTAKHATARIELGVANATHGTHGTAYFVADDGAGFEPAHTAKLFAPFRRLHAQEEFEGTGIGLATVRRIVQRHGGRTWAEGRIEKGATIWFTLAEHAKGA